MWLPKVSDGKYITIAKVEYKYKGDDEELVYCVVKLGFWRDDEMRELILKKAWEREHDHVITVTRLEVYGYGRDTLILAFAALALDKTEKLLSDIYTTEARRAEKRAKRTKNTQ